MFKMAIEIVAFAAVGCIWLFWLDYLLKALLISWIKRREKREQRANILRSWLKKGLTKDEADRLIYGNSGPNKPGLINTFASIAAKHVRTWKEWNDLGEE